MEKNKIMMIVIIALLLVLIGTIAGLSMYAMRILGKETAAVPQDDKKSAVLDQEKQDMVPLGDALYTNLAKSNDNQEHVIRIKLTIAVDNTDKKASPALVTLLGERTVVIKDVVIGVLRTKTYEELLTMNAQEVLREEILTKLQQEFDTNLIATVYIDDLFLQ